MRSNSKHAGFTLIELLVVISLVGLVVTLVVLRIERDAGQLAQLEAERFYALVTHVQDESLLSGRPYAVEVDEANGSYRFLKPGQPWQVITNDDVLRSRQVPEGVKLHMEMQQLNTIGRMVVIDGLGLVTPFVLTISGGAKEFEVFSDTGQTVILKKDATAPQKKRG